VDGTDPLSPPAVTVVIPTYNRARVLGRALDSVRAQTFQDLEIVVVDDGSADDTAAVVAGYRDARIRRLSLERRSGAARARNVGIGVARGEWVAFLDSDDEWLPPKLEAQLARAANADRRVDAVYCLRSIHDHLTGRARPQRSPLHEGDVFDALLRGGWTPPTSLVMVRRAALEAVGGFDEALPSFQDYDLWLRLAQRGSWFAAVDAVLVVKHHHEGPQITRDYAARIEGVAAVDAKWGATIRDRLGVTAHRQWRDARLTALPTAQLRQVRAALAGGDRALAWRLCGGMWRAPREVRWRFGGRALALILLGRRAYGALERLAGGRRR
jgi:glycosyltransferase involved in cell wall biosynthesis